MNFIDYFAYCHCVKLVIGRLGRSVLLVMETGVPGEKHWPVASHWQKFIA